MPRFKKCQSCGMPLNKDPEGGGKNSDGSTSDMYCSFCFGEGELLQPDMTLEEMKVLVKGKMKEMGVPGFLTGLFTMGMANLERWKV